MYICTHASTSETTARQRLRRKPDLTPRSSALLPVRCNPGEGYPSWPAAQLPVHEERRISAEQPQPTAAHHTITTARRPNHIRLSALVRSRSTQFMAHPSCQLGRGPPKRCHLSAILAGITLVHPLTGSLVHHVFFFQKILFLSCTIPTIHIDH